MISTSNVSLNFGAKKLFDDVNVKFTPGNCYGLIGANGAGKTTFLKILSKELEPNTGEVILPPKMRLSVLKQNHNAYDDFTVMQTVMMGNQRLFQVMAEKEQLYAKPDFSEEDGVKASNLETEFAELNGWEAESEASTMLAELKIPNEIHDKLMKDLDSGDKVKVLLAQALFGQPDILLLDEPTNNLDIRAVQWLENFLMNFKNTVIVVSHDRHLLNTVCTHMADIDYSKITIYTGNYEFWRQATELNQKLRSDQNKKNADKAEELKSFIARFSANASKSRQASSRQKQLEKLDLSDMPVSTRRTPFVGFNPARELGNDLLTVNGLSKTVNGEVILKNVSFILNKSDKVAFLSSNDVSVTTLFEILTGQMQPDAGSFSWGITTSLSYFPNDNSHFFKSSPAPTLVDWLRDFSQEKDESFLRGF